mmetsp:Transcript_23633/g.24257  ORF Transcript_23633/g.24257 Transcript_23633/m.24257 type:complete len:131 (+) Transcript_23633:19-411(+)
MSKRGMNYRANNNSYNNSNISPYSYGNKDQRAAEVNRTIIEQENDQRWLELGEQVSLLKALSEDINQEVKSQNSLLDSMGSNMTSASDLFSGTIQKLTSMIASNSSSHMYYLVGFVVFVFLVIYFMMGRK